jgi:hypothetical protein
MTGAWNDPAVRAAVAATIAADPDGGPGPYTCPGCGADRDPDFREAHGYDCPVVAELDAER